MNNLPHSKVQSTLQLILVGVFLVVLFLFSGCEEEPKPNCLDFGDNPKQIANPKKCIPKEF